MILTSGLVCARRPEPLDIGWVIEEEEQTYTQNLYDALTASGTSHKIALLRFSYSSTVHRTARARLREATAPENVEKARGDPYWLD